MLSMRFTDADAFAQAIRGADVDYTPLSPGAYESRLTALMLGRISVQRAIDRSHMTRGAMRRNAVTILTPMGMARDPVVNGEPATVTDIVLLQPGAELHAICRNHQDWATVSLDTEDFEELAELWALPPNVARTPALLFGIPGIARQFQDAIAALTDLADHMPEAVGAREVGTRLGEALFEILTRFRYRAGEHPPRPRSLRNSARLVAEADEYLRAHASDPIYSSELCRALGVSQRRLHYAFSDSCGMSPQTYLKYRRLVLVRRALKVRDPTMNLVKSVALAHGFWHLGHFARDYRAYFGELPSATLRGAEGGRLAAE